MFDSFAERYAQYGYPVLFFGVLLENAGIPIPGETAVLVAAFLASPAGGGRFHLGCVIVLAASAAVLGDNAGYWLGRRFARPRLRDGRGLFLLTPERFRMVEDYFHRYGIWTVFFARFVAVLRVVGALAAGAAGMTWPRFFPANAAGAAAWASAISLVGYYFGKNWEAIHRWFGWGVWVVVAAVVAALALKHWRGGRARPAPPPGDAGPPTSR
jgi:membrane-associated protein